MMFVGTKQNQKWYEVNGRRTLAAPGSLQPKRPVDYSATAYGLVKRTHARRGISTLGGGGGVVSAIAQSFLGAINAFESYRMVLSFKNQVSCDDGLEIWIILLLKTPALLRII